MQQASQKRGLLLPKFGEGVEGRCPSSQMVVCLHMCRVVWSGVGRPAFRVDGCGLWLVLAVCTCGSGSKECGCAGSRVFSRIVVQEAKRAGVQLATRASARRPWLTLWVHRAGPTCRFIPGDRAGGKDQMPGQCPV